MIKHLSLLGATLLLAGPALFAQATGAPATGTGAPATGTPVTGEPRKAAESDEMDRPAAPTKVTLPPVGAPVPPPPGPVAPPSNEVPPIETDPVQPPPIETVEPPQFFGETISGKFVWTLDRSGSMGAIDSGSGPIEGAGGDIISNPNRIQIVKSECIRVLTQLAEEDMFAIVTFGSNPEWTWYDQMVAATPGNVSQAVAFVSAMAANGWTPCFHALELSCDYDVDTNKLFLLCDGQPNAGGGPSEILAAFPGWFQPMRDSGCTLVCVHIGTSGLAAQFMQDLANGNGGIYIHK